MSTNKYFTIISLSSTFLALLLLVGVSFNGMMAPVTLYIMMIVSISILIFILASKETVLKLNLFLFFFSLYLIYTLVQHYIFIIYSPEFPYNFLDEPKFYHFSELALPYLTGDKNFSELFSNWKLPLHDLPLHTVFSGSIAYFSTMIDGNNSIVIQKMLSPFFGGLLTVFLYATIKDHFKDTKFALNATLGYGLLSAVFMYSTPMLRDIDVALAYMIFFYIFLKKFTVFHLGILFVMAFITIYLRVESGMLLYGLVFLYIYFYVQNINDKSIKYILYVFFIVVGVLVVMIMYKKIVGKIVSVDTAYTSMGIERSSQGAISLLFNKLPFGISHTAKLLFSQMKPFPFIGAIDRPLEAMSGLLWPLVFVLAIYAIMKKNIRNFIDVKIQYLLLVAIIVLYLMSSGPLVRRMLSVYPIIYIVSLYVLYLIPFNRIKVIFVYYLITIISLNTLYYFIKL